LRDLAEDLGKPTPGQPRVEAGDCLLASIRPDAGRIDAHASEHAPDGSFQACRVAGGEPCTARSVEIFDRADGVAGHDGRPAGKRLGGGESKGLVMARYDA
jgi:hypothetical protein